MNFEKAQEKAREVTLSKLHQACEKAYLFDRELFANNPAAKNNEYLGSYYGVFEFSDWPAYVRKLEKEMAALNILFTPIKLTP